MTVTGVDIIQLTSVWTPRVSCGTPKSGMAQCAFSKVFTLQFTVVTRSFRKTLLKDAFSGKSKLPVK